MATLIIRTYQGKTDWLEIERLINICDQADQLDAEFSAKALKIRLEADTVNSDQDVRLWFDESGNLIAFALLDLYPTNYVIDAYLWCYVHPLERCHGLENEAIIWSEKRLKEIGKEQGIAVKLRFYSRDDEFDWNRLLRQNGFAVDRYFVNMAVSLDHQVIAPKLPDGFHLVCLTDKSDIHNWVAMYNDSFNEHWNHHDLTVAKVQQWLKESDYQPELNLIAVDEQGNFAAFCYAEIKTQMRPDQTVDQYGWINFLGTHSQYRGQGLGKAMLLTGLQRLQAAGMSIAKLSVDADNSTGALRLYRAVGFRPVDTWFVWGK